MLYVLEASLTRNPITISVTVPPTQVTPQGSIAQRIYGGTRWNAREQMTSDLPNRRSGEEGVMWRKDWHRLWEARLRRMWSSGRFKAVAPKGASMWDLVDMSQPTMS